MQLCQQCGQPLGNGAHQCGARRGVPAQAMNGIAALGMLVLSVAFFVSMLRWHGQATAAQLVITTPAPGQQSAPAVGTATGEATAVSGGGGIGPTATSVTRHQRATPTPTSSTGGTQPPTTPPAEPTAPPTTVPPTIPLPTATPTRSILQ